MHYDLWGQVVRITDARQQESELQYDRLGRLVRETQPGGASTSLGYDPAGNVLSIIDPRQQRVEFSYDDAGRLSSKRTFASLTASTPSRTVSFSYNGRGELLGYFDGEHSASYTRDDLGRLLTGTIDFGSFSKEVEYRYDGDGLVTVFRGPDGGMLHYTYDAAGLLRTVGLAGDWQLTYGGYRWFSPKPTGAT